MSVSFGITTVDEPLPITAAPGDIPAKLQRGLSCDDGQWRSRYPGVLAHQGRLVVVLPRFYAGASADHLDDAPLVFLGALCRVLREARRSVTDHDVWLEQAVIASDQAWQLLDQIEAALLLARDHAEHGPIRIHEAVASQRVPGAIRWSRTIARSVAVVSGGSVTMADPVQVRRRIDLQHPLTALHEAVCAEVHAVLGLGGDVAEPVVRRAARATLERYDRALFQDRHRIVADLIARYLGAAGLGGAREARQVHGVLANSFPMVWERMLKLVLGPERPPSLPGGSYRGPAGTAVSGGLRLIPDLVIDGRVDDQPVIVVLDAKDYAPGQTGHWPDTASIGKQLLYRYLLSDQYKPGQLGLAHIGNAFALPARLTGDHHACCAVHDLDGETGPAPFGRIVCVDVDFDRVARAYVRGQRDGELRRAIAVTVMRAMRA